MTAGGDYTIPAASAARPPLSLVVLIHRRDGFACAYCGATPAELHVDHVRPLAHFAATASPSAVNDPSNLVTACVDCNQAKGPQNLAGFAELLRGRGIPPRTVTRMIRRANAARRRPFPVPAKA